MKKVVWKFGLLSGAVVAAIMGLSFPIVERSGYRYGEALGYTGLVLGGLVVFFGIRAYREGEGGGRLTFGRGLAIGLLISLVSTLCYIAAWELANFTFLPGMGERFAVGMVESAKTRGASQVEIEKLEAQAEQLRQLFANPLSLAAICFLESFPIGALVSLISAGILRRREPAMAA